MSWKLASSLAPVTRLWGTLAFRLTAAYALAGLFLVFFATASLYLVLLTELEKSTDLFLGDKLHVLRIMLRESPDDWDALREEVELESAAQASGGTGLGLAIVQGITLLHGGKVEITSHQGKGPRVTLRMPVSADKSLAEEHRP